MRIAERSIAIDDLLVLPPGFAAAPSGGDPWDEGVRLAAAGADPGTVCWAEVGGGLRAAVVLAPDRAIPDAGPVMALGALALFDALAVLAPPQVPMHLLPPDGLAVDSGRVATLRAVLAPCPPGAVADWAVLGIEVAVGTGGADPGDTPNRTNLHEEGFGDVTAADVLTHTLRHLLSWVDAWGEDGQPALDHALRQRGERPAVPAPVPA